MCNGEYTLFHWLTVPFLTQISLPKAEISLAISTKSLVFYWQKINAHGCNSNADILCSAKL
jgi:hypothetical protein